MLRKRFRILAAVHLFLIQDDKLLLLRRFQTSYEDSNSSGVAGHLDGNEELTSAMAREAKEEAKIEMNPPHLQVVGVMHRYFGGDEAINFFLPATCWEGSVANGEPHTGDDLASHAPHPRTLALEYLPAILYQQNDERLPIR